MDDFQKPQYAGLKVNTGNRAKHYLYYWEEIRTPAPHPSRRSYHGSATWRDKLIVIGGQDLRDGPQREIWSISLFSGLERWEKIPESIGPMFGCSALVHEDSLYIFGGTNGSVEWDLMRILHLPTYRWREVEAAGNCPPAIDSHSASLYEDSILIFGGFIAGRRSNSLFSFSLSSETWREIPTENPPCPRSSHSAAVHGNTLYVFGGADEEGEKLGDLWGLDLNSYRWELIDASGNLPIPRSGHSAVVFKDLMIVFGGMKDITKETNEMFSFDFKTKNWIMFQSEHKVKDPITAEQIEEFKKSRSPVRSFRRSMTNITDRSPTKLTPVKRAQSPIKRQGTFGDKSPDETSPRKKRRQTSNLYDGPPAPLLGRVRGSAPHPRDGHSAIIIANHMIVFGGDRHQMPFNDLYSYALDETIARTPAHD